MSGTDDSPTGEEYGVAEVNDRGRLTIPKELRDDLQIEGGTRFTASGGVVIFGSSVASPSYGRSRPADPTKSGGEEAFRDAGEATFGGR